MKTTISSAVTVDVYEIRVEGQLEGKHWSIWFDGWCVTSDSPGETVLTGPVADQAALFGVLMRVRDLGLPLISATRIAGR